MNIVVIGSINIDMVIKTERLPNLGETLNGSGFSTICGGKGANQAVALGKLSTQKNIAMIGCVGKDIYGKTLLDNLTTHNVQTTGVTQLAVNSGVAVITVCGGDNHIILDAGANGMVTRDIIDENLNVLNWADIVVLQLEIPMETVSYVARMAKSLGKMVVLNPAPMVDLPQSLMNSVDLFVPNEHEASIYLGRPIETIEQAKEAVLEIVGRGIKQCIITLGKKGCVYNNLDKVCHEPICEIKVVDTTAAGDSFIAGVLTGLASGKDITESVKFATKVSAITVSRFGASSSLPTLEEVENFGK